LVLNSLLDFVGFDAGGADVGPLNGAGKNHADFLEVGQKSAASVAPRMTDSVSAAWAFRAN